MGCCSIRPDAVHIPRVVRHNVDEAIGRPVRHAGHVFVRSETCDRGNCAGEVVNSEKRMIPPPPSGCHKQIAIPIKCELSRLTWQGNGQQCGIPVATTAIFTATGPAESMYNSETAALLVNFEERAGTAAA